MPGKIALGRQPIDERPEPYALHHTSDLEFAPDRCDLVFRVFDLGWHERVRHGR